MDKKSIGTPPEIELPEEYRDIFSLYLSPEGYLVAKPALCHLSKQYKCYFFQPIYIYIRTYSEPPSVEEIEPILKEIVRLIKGQLVTYFKDTSEIPTDQWGTKDMDEEQRRTYTAFKKLIDY